MRTGWLEIELCSELCTATGEGIAGMIDMEIAHEHGLPVIPAKRIKGCLLEAAKELRDNGIASPEELKLMFGGSGQDKSGVLHIYDAHIYKVPDLIELEGETTGYEVVEDYEALVQELKKHEEISPAEVLEAFTLLRTRTAMDAESGSAAKTSLRTLRVLKKSMVLRCKVHIKSCPEEDALEQLLGMCAKGLRNMGLGKTRGLGEVRCRLGKMSMQADLLPELFSIPYAEQEEVELNYQLHLENPVMFPEQNGLYNTCEDWIPGSALLGALAGMYIEDHKLGGTAHEDGRFAQIFLRSGVKFGYAFPAVDGKVFYPCPASWQRVKDEERYYDLAYGEKPPDVQLRGEKQLVCPDKNAVNVYEPAKQVRMHHARPEDRGIGHALGEEARLENRETKPGASDTGRFFQYISLCAGQGFAGTWRGKAGDIRELLECLRKRGNKLQLGRSRTAEYGDVAFKFKDVAAVSDKKRVMQETQSKRFTLWLITPMVLCDAETGRTVSDPQKLIDQLNAELDCGARLKKSFLRFAELAGYNSKWRLPKPQRQALAAGSALVIETEKPVAPVDIELKSWGENSAEGCGMVKVIAYDKGLLANPGEQVSQYREMIREQYCKKGEKNLERKGCPLVHALLEKKRRMLAEQLERQDALSKVPEELKKVNPTTIHQIIALFDAYKDYNRVKTELEEISDEHKKEKALAFIKPCEGRSLAFFTTYLQNAKWQAREGRK